MDWRERTYYWVMLNCNGRRPKLTYKDWDSGGVNYERRVRELKKIPGLKMHPLPNMALAPEERKKVPEWAQMIVSCRKAHNETLMNMLRGFAEEQYGNCLALKIVEPVKKAAPKEGRAKVKNGRWELKVGDKVRVLDGSGIANYCGGWSFPMEVYIGMVYEVSGVYKRLDGGDGSRVRLGTNIYDWDSRGLELVEAAETDKEPKAEEAPAAPVVVREFKIRNSAGVLTVKAERELSLYDVFSGRGDDKLPAMTRPRLEIHSGGDHWGGMLVTLSDRDDADKGMYVIEIPADYDGGKPRAWLCQYGTEQPDDAYVTMEPWRDE